MQTENKHKNGKFAGGNTVGNRWQKGQSGNPAGRPKSALLSDALRKQLAETDKDGKSVAEKVAAALIQKAKGGDVQAIREVFDRAEGKAQQSIDVEMNVTDWQMIIRDYGISESEVLDVAKQLLLDGRDAESAFE